MPKFEPEFCRNESEVISKLIVSYLLPELGYSLDDWHQEVKVANIRLDFLALVTPVIPFVLDKIKPLSIVIEAKNPDEKLYRHTRKLKRYLNNLNVRYGLLTNGKKLKIYARDNDEEIKLIFECSGKKIATKIDDIRAILGKKSLIKANEINAPAGDIAEETDEKKYENSEFQNSSISKPHHKIIKKTIRETSNMQVLAIYHNKGGVGKTTISVNLAASFSRKGKRVLLIDMDAQANTTFATGLIKFQFEEDDNIRNNYVYHLLESGDFNFIPDMVRCSDDFNTPEVDVIPSHINLIEHQDKLNKIAASRSRLIVKLKQVENDYDIVIIDTPPSRDLYAEIPLIAADYLIIPSDLKPFANQGLSNVKKFVGQINEYREAIARAPLVILGVLPSKISTNSQYLKHTFPKQKDVVPQRHKLPLMESIIYERTPLSNSLNHIKEEDDVERPDPKSIFEFCEIKSTPSAEQAAEDFETLATEIMNKIK
ncbi:AAA family ATPase [Desulfobacter latus]|uniref:AAA family ATPase n=1 Tax=Desulfobacter latus TaxID=2292 RepID=A0A850SZ27_9BACT|nr:AAA family ATPase [Desulfobacter latus]NWH06554.1 AAA family ATPase [Desulfobacter latus]